MTGFSHESLQRIETALKLVPAGNSYFSMSLDTDEISAHYLWSEGIEICFRDGRYICTQHLERSTKTFEIPDEDQAVEKFIAIAQHRKAEILKY